MAINRGVLGTQTGSMGGITASNWKGRNVYKQKVPARNGSNSPAQQLQRRKFAALAVLAGLFGPAIRRGFKVAASDVTEQNVFQKLNFDAVSDNGTTATVDYEMLRLSTGTVGAPAGFDVVVTPITGSINVSWADNSNGADALSSDMAQVVYIQKSTGQTYFNMYTDTRADGGGAGVIPFGPNISAADIQAYMFFKRATSVSTSPSAYAQAHV